MPVPSKRNKKTGQFTPDARLRNARFRERARRLYVDQGMSLRAAGEKLGLPLPQIQWLVNDLGVMRKKQANTSKLRANADRVVQLYCKEEKSCGDIALLFKVNASAVEELIDELGVRKRTTSENSIIRGKRGTLPGQIAHERNWKEYTSVDTMTISSYDDYLWYVRRLSAAVMHRYGVHLDPENKQSRAWHIDHVYSIHQGWWIWSEQAGEFVARKRPMPLTKICHPANLRLIAGRQNAMKGIYCAHDAVTLGKRIVEFEQEHGKVFDGKSS